MSLEEAVQANTAAVLTLTATIEALIAAQGAPAAIVKSDNAKAPATRGIVSSDDPAVKAIVADKAVQAATVTQATPATQTAQAGDAAKVEPKVLPVSPEDAVAPPSYADVVEAVNALAKAKGRGAVASLFKEFNIANGRELQPEQFAQMIADAHRDTVAA